MFRPAIKSIATPVLVVTSIFVVHAVVRFGGLWNAQFIPLSMVIIWPLPWVLSPRDARREMGFKAPQSYRWFLIGPVVAIGTLAFCVAFAWGLFGASSANWFTRHALVLQEALASVPPSTTAVQFWIVTIPAMIFSPLAEEFLYRGFILTSVSRTWGFRAATSIQATAFALVHLAHYGLQPFNLALIAVWLPSMFLVALMFGWIVQKSGSLWPAVVSHSLFNFGLNLTTFWLLPEFVGI